MRGAGLVVLAVLIALAGTVGIIAFLQSRDDPDLGATDDAPGIAAAENDERLRDGNVILTYRRGADGGELRALAEEIAGPPDDALVDAGQAIIVLHRPNQTAGNVVAHALGRRLVAERGDDPAVREFTEYWLGRAAGE